MTMLLDRQKAWKPSLSTLEKSRSANFDVGLGRQTSHWGEDIQGPFEHNGRVITALITLPRYDRFATAIFWPAPGEPLTVRPCYARKALRAAQKHSVVPDTPILAENCI